MLSKFQSILDSPDLPRREVAAKLGCSPGYVSQVRWRAANPERDRKLRLRWLRERGVAPGQQIAVVTDDVRARVIELRMSGVSQTETARRLGLSNGQVAGIMHRHRKAQEARS